MKSVHAIVSYARPIKPGHSRYQLLTKCGIDITSEDIGKHYKTTSSWSKVSCEYCLRFKRPGNKLLTIGEVAKSLTEAINKSTEGLTPIEKKEFMEALSNHFFNMRFK
jgi:hypothetical protein